jgi:hypothetical protein
MKKYLLPTVIALSALSVSLSAAFYSVTGLSMLFAGASFAVLIMASSLEVAKLVIASLLYQYWGKLNKILRTYLTVAACVLCSLADDAVFTSGAGRGGLPRGFVSISARPNMAPPSFFDLRDLFFFATIGSPEPNTPLVASSGKP